MNADRIRRALGWATLIVACVISAKFLVLALTASANTSDFTVFWTAGRIDPASVYDHRLITEAQRPITKLSGENVRPFVYPPSSLLLFRPLAMIPFEWAYFGWIGLLALVFACASAKSFGPWTTMLALLSPPLVYGIWGGQPSLLTAALILFAVHLMACRPIAAGLLMGIGAAIKPQCLVLVPLALVATGNWRTLMGFALGSLIPIAVSAVLWPRLWIEWISAVAEFPSIIRELGLDRSGVSPAAIAPALGFPSGVGVLIQIAGMMLGLWLVWFTWRGPVNPAKRATGLLSATILVSPYAMPYELAGIMPATVAALLRGKLLLGLCVVPPLAKFMLPVAAMMECRKGRMDARRGFEPRLTESESVVLPLDDRAARRRRAGQ